MKVHWARELARRTRLDRAAEGIRHLRQVDMQPELSWAVLWRAGRAQPHGDYPRSAGISARVAGQFEARSPDP